MTINVPINILLVDDNPAKLLTYETMLSGLGENLFRATSAREALEEMLKSDIGVVLTDVRMPDMSGFDLAAMIREHPRFQDTAIIFVSAVYLTDADRLRGFNLGAIDYITVPVAPDLFRARVKVVADLYRNTRQLKQLTAELEQRVAERTAALAKSEKRLREALRLTSVASEAGRVGVWHFDIDSNRLTCSDELLTLIGIDSSQFDGTREAVEAVVHPDDIERYRARWAKALAESERLECDFRIVPQDGEVRWLHSRGSIVRRRDGTAEQAYGVMLDITDRKQDEERHRLVIAELDHRLNNTLARIDVLVQQSIAQHSQATAASIGALTSALTGRLSAMARAHMRLSQSNWTGASLKQLVEEELALGSEGQANVSLEGPDLAVTPQATRALAMVFHELATNAVKYGALSNDDGQVAVGWQLTGQDASVQLKLVWQETGGPPVAAPKRQGFGTRLIHTVVRGELGGQLDLIFAPMGVRYEMKIPLARLTGAADRLPDE
jgi:PAS domain S-box-containing protein